MKRRSSTSRFTAGCRVGLSVNCLALTLLMPLIAESAPKPLAAPIELPFKNDLGKEITDVAISPDGKLVAAATSGHRAVIWEASSGRKINELATGGATRSVSFSPDGKTLAVASSDGVVFLWTVTGKSARKVNITDDNNASADVAGVAFSPKGKQVAAIGYRDFLWIIDAANGKAKRIAPGDNLIAQAKMVRYAPDGNHIAVCNTSAVSLFHPDGKTFGAWNTQNEARAISIGEKGELTAVADVRLIQFWTIGEDQPRDVKTAANILDLAFIASKPKYLAGITPMAVQILSSSDGSVLWEAKVSNPTRLAISKTGSKLVVGSTDGSAFVYAIPAAILQSL